MKLNTTDFRRKCQHPLLLALASVPAALIVTVNAAPAALGMMWSLPTAYVLLSWGCILIPGRKRLLAGLLSMAVMVGLALLLPLREIPVLLLLPLM